MKATRAYIASLGTTGVLLASSISLLLVVSAIFAFNGWPDSGLADKVQKLFVQDDKPSFRVAGPSQAATDAAPAAGGVAAAPAAGTPAAAATAPGGTAGGPGGGPGGTTGGGGGSATGGGPTTTTPGTTAGGGQGTGLPNLNPNLPPVDSGGVKNSLGNTTQGTTQNLGQTLKPVSPQLGDTVTNAGDTVSQTIRGLPLK
jgi:hypothetical protein